ncbi:MAG TPA: bifunctional phosphopantothenoylcysteine decarboxylase/phosphopantothenate--cysteine ligase CoaBC [Bacteroidota bacterium]|nr:bifunctional phosphopantothenoylcysteine decarboxylase/phosphopantothenate--cysteine ligase CoaBC [Bacteroidota bacterium]
MLNGKKILLGVTGGIAAYKSCYLVREFVKNGASVKVVMTPSATKFVSPLTFSTLSNNPVSADIWSSDQTTHSDIGTRHIDTANWPDVYLVAPASAHTVSKLTHGSADTLVSLIALATRAPIILAPTMDADMYLNDVTKGNLARLRERGYRVIEPDFGEHASGLSGPGRFPEIDSIIKTVEAVLSGTHRDLRKKRILVTAGPTYEAIDPVRFIGNRSSGKMGFAIANAAAQRGAEVTLIAGPVRLETPRNVARIDVESAKEMFEAVRSHAKRKDAVIMAAAVADFTPAAPAVQKVKKTSPESVPELRLKTTPDILATLGSGKSGGVLVGFALETENGLENAKTKLRRKNLDLMILNTVTKKHSAIGSETNVATLIDRSGAVEELPELPKFDVANRILDRVRALL